MKLLNCTACHDIFALTDKRVRICICGASSGKYVTDIKVLISGPSRVLGIRNDDYVQSMAVAGQWKWFTMEDGPDIERRFDHGEPQKRKT